MSNKAFQPAQFPGYHCVGWVKSAHGIRGEIYIQLYAKKADWLKSLETVFLLAPRAAALVEWPIEFKRPHKEGLILKLKGVVDRNHSETIAKSGAYIPENLLKSEAGDAIYLKQVLGFTLLDAQGTRIGKIVGFKSNAAQDLLQIERENAPEALVPFVDAFLVNIDFDKLTVKMDLPEGLLDP